MKGSLFFGSQDSLFLSNPNKGIRSAASRQSNKINYHTIIYQDIHLYINHLSHDSYCF